MIFNRLRSLLFVGILLCALLFFGYTPSVVQAAPCSFNTGENTLTADCTLGSTVDISGNVTINGGGIPSPHHQKETHLSLMARGRLA